MGYYRYNNCFNYFALSSNLHFKHLNNYVIKCFKFWAFIHLIPFFRLKNMEFYCIKCKNTITDEEYHFSSDNFGKPLCRAHQPTLEARKLGKKLEQLGNWEVIFEHYDGYKTVDIRLPGPKIDIEVDGLQHSMTKQQALSDLKRTYYSYKKDGFITLHIPNILVRDDKAIHEAAEYINEFLEVNYSDVKDNFIVRFLKGLFSTS